MKNIKTIVTAAALGSVLLCGSVLAQSTKSQLSIQFSNCVAQSTYAAPTDDQHPKDFGYDVTTSTPKGWTITNTDPNVIPYTLHADVQHLIIGRDRNTVRVHGKSGLYNINASCDYKLVK